MIPAKILYVDDEAMALKYFAHLISPLAPVLTAISVAEGKAMLDEHGADIAVLVSDQRMPGARGNELLRYAREHHPGVVRMLTTAYSELDEAIEAINAGEIYRYITKPWDLQSLNTDLRNALEVAALRAERNVLLREKMLVQQQQLLGQRAGQLVLACAGLGSGDSAHAIHVFLQAALAASCPAPSIDWRLLDYADLVQEETARGIAIGQQLAQWQQQFASAATPAEALAALVQALPGQAQLQGSTARVTDPSAFTALLAWPTQDPVTPVQTAWLAWLMRWSDTVQVRSAGSGCEVSMRNEKAAGNLANGWLADDIEQLLAAATTA
jgi:two-component system probable response regulator PhcQ